MIFNPIANGVIVLKIRLFICSVATILFVGYLYQVKIQGQSEYEICQSFRFASPNYTDTRINVVVNIKDYELEQLFDDIRAFHNELNGEPDELTIHLYRSRKGYKKGKCIGTKTYLKERLKEE